MRLKVLIPSLIILAAILAIFLQHQKQSSFPPIPASRTSQSSVSISNVPTIAQKSNDASQPIASSSQKQLPFSDDRGRTNGIGQYMESLNAPIKFFGEIVDQDGNPLANAIVQGEVLHLKVIVPVPGGDQDQIVPINQTTDSGGRFQIQDVAGRSLQIESIQKNGYEVEPDNCPRSFGPSIGTYENPTVFKMWNTNIHEQLITGEKKFQIVPDGKPYFINLTKGEISQTDNGDLKVWIQYTNQPVPSQFSDWSAEIDVVNGGLQASGSYSMFSAPVEGYVPTFQLQQRIKGGQRGSTGAKRFYIKLNNGQEYGRITINLFAPYNDSVPGLVRIQYAINPSGSQTLR